MPLVVVPTPLGNLSDVTLRAIEALRNADFIVAEDTRVARKLLGALGIAAPPLAGYREQNAATATGAILDRARDALVVLTCDAGLPGISDPGSDLVAAARAAGIAVEVLPGPSAAFGVAVLSGFPLRRFCFEGFPPRTSRQRRAAFAAGLETGATTIWYESPRRIRATLADLAAVEPDARVFLVREYTKLHEQQVLGSPPEVSAALPEPVRGEIAFAIAPCTRTAAPSPADADTIVDALLARGVRLADIAKSLARDGYGSRSELYARAHARKTASKGRAPSTERNGPRR